ncbi:MAG TPA: beta-propeller fold lactonase family protein [Bryobacteraceae bacterium]|nr:beta-propeller fold lactonase family protein [Bryobacteraceae bacterium]
MIGIARNLLTILVSAGAVLPMAGAAAVASKPGAVFVMTNAAGKNEIVTFQRTADGHLFDGSRYETGGRGSGGLVDPLQSQGSLTLSQDHSMLFAVNSGSGTLSVFSVKKATLSLVEKVPTGGSAPVAVAQFQNLVFVLNTGGSGSVVSFRLDPSGLKKIAHSTVFLTSSNAAGASLAVSPDGQFLLVSERLGNNIDAFRIQADGTLAPVVVTPSVGAGAFSVIFAPNGTAIVSETGPAGTTNESAVSSYSLMSNGMLSPISKSVPTLGTANCWNVITPDGKFVYVSNSASATVAGFAIGQGGNLTPIAGTVVGTNPAGSANLDIAASDDGKYLFTLNAGTGNISIFGIQQDGALTNLGDAGDLPKASGFNGIAAF